MRHGDGASIHLVSAGGVRCSDFAIAGAMRATAFLKESAELQHILTNLHLPISRCRLVQLAGNSSTPIEAKQTYHWFRRVPIYIPIVTNENVQFSYDGDMIQMRAGEAWTFDPHRPYGLINNSTQPCIHLVVETRIEETNAHSCGDGEPKADALQIEPYLFEVLTPDEFRTLSAETLHSLQQEPDYPQLAAAVDSLHAAWETTFARYGHDRLGELAYQDLILAFQEKVASKVHRRVNGAGKHAIEVIRTMLWPTPPKRKRVDWKLLKSQRRKAKLMAQGGDRPEFDRPIFIVSAPRAGSTLLFETLSRFPDLWTIGIESHETIEGIPDLHPDAHGFESNRLQAKDATPEIIETIKNRFAWQLENRTGDIWLECENRPQQVRFLEKTPKNALRIPFLKTAFPDAKFIYLYREPEPNISSMLEGWRTLRFIAYPQVKGWPYKIWSFLLTPGWQALRDCSLVEIVANQWQVTQDAIVNDLAQLPRTDWCRIDYKELVQDPYTAVQTIAQFADLRWDDVVEQRVSRALPVSRMVLSKPDPDKWRKNAEEIAAVSTHPPRGNMSVKVLFVHDQPNKDVVATLRNLGYQITEAANAEDAARKVQQVRAGCAVVVRDSAETRPNVQTPSKPKTSTPNPAFQTQLARLQAMEEQIANASR